MENNSKSSKVGYRKPPRDTRFPKGKSGNYEGRPKGRKTESGGITKAIAEKITVIIKGKRQVMTKEEAANCQLANAAASGDLKAIELVRRLKEREDDAALRRHATLIDGEIKRLTDEELERALEEAHREWQAIKDKEHQMSWTARSAPHPTKTSS